MPLPLEIIGLDKPTITLVWEDGHQTVYPARDLRLACRCAQCIEEMTGVPLLDPKKVPADVRAAGMELVGQYAVAIRWSDGHVGGIHNFRTLRESCPCAECAAGRAKAG
jgi:ATP-binding protein involved in chromosome partitioning